MTPQWAERLRPVAGDPLVDGRRTAAVVPLDHQAGGRAVRGVQPVVAVEHHARQRAVQHHRRHPHPRDVHVRVAWGKGRSGELCRSFEARVALEKEGVVSCVGFLKRDSLNVLTYKNKNSFKKVGKYDDNFSAGNCF